MGVLEIIAGVVGLLGGIALLSISILGLLKIVKKEDEFYNVRIAKEKEIVELLMRYNGHDY